MDANHRSFSVGGVAIDLDGTLLDTVVDLTNAVNALLEELGDPPLPGDRIRALIGKGMNNLVRRALAEARGVSPETIGDDAIRTALVRYQEHYAARLGRDTTVYPGVREGLELLRSKGLPLAVVTNKASRFVRPHLAQAGIEGFFDLVIGADDLPTKKPAPGPLLHVASVFALAPGELLMVGDSINDAQAARSAGCPILVVPYGYNEGRAVETLDVDGIVPSLHAAAERVRPLSPR